MAVSKIYLHEFMAKAISNGANLTGCIIECSQSSYRFDGIDEDGKIEISYGGDFQEQSTLVRHIRVYSVSMTSPVKLKPGLRNHSITIHCKNQR